MKYINYIYALVFLLTLSVVSCDKADDTGLGDDMVQVEGIMLGLGEQVETAGVSEYSGKSTTRATVDGVTYAVNTNEDPTRTKDGNNRITGRNSWKLDLEVFNGDVTAKYGPASFAGGTSLDGINWKPSGELLFPNYFRPWASAWLYHTTKDLAVDTDQSDAVKLLAQDQLYRPKSELSIIAKRITLELRHQRAMINFKFEDIVRSDINEETVIVKVGPNVYKPYNVRTTGVLEYMLILPETATSSGMTIEYSTKGNTLQQPIKYIQEVTLNNNAALGSNNAYCFTLSGKEMKISPVTIVNWVTGEPVSGEYVAVTAYPTFKGPNNSTYYFYYDNKLTEDGTPILQEINFNNDGECTIKPDGRIITHIVEKSDYDAITELTESNLDLYKLDDPIILGDSQKMYINLTDILPYTTP